MSAFISADWEITMSNRSKPMTFAAKYKEGDYVEYLTKNGNGDLTNGVIQSVDYNNGWRYHIGKWSVPESGINMKIDKYTHERRKL